jgi:endonuclease/exonuclease/phosphatase family metal-dependent hydrolase
VNGLNFHPDATVQVVHAQSSRTLEVSTSYVSASQFMVTIPSTAGCGVYYVTVYNPNTLPASNSKGIDYCPSNVLNVLSYNVAMLPDIACGGNVFCQTKDTRAPLIARHPDVQGHDVIIFQEAFADSHRETMVEILSHPYHGYVYYTQVLGSDDAWEQDGGVIILSRWPIENGEGEERTFGDACYGDLISGAEFDCLADKGVLYARINKLGQRYHIFGTHLDAGGEEGDRNAREQQLKIIAGFMSEQAIFGSEPVVIGGDFNIDDHEERQNITQILNVSGPPREGYGYTDEENNNYYPTSPSSGQALDYVFYSNSHLMPVSAINQVRQPKDDSGQDLSDHYAVLGSFVFP